MSIGNHRSPSLGLVALAHSQQQSLVEVTRGQRGEEGDVDSSGNYNNDYDDDHDDDHGDDDDGRRERSSSINKVPVTYLRRNASPSPTPRLLV
jgi:hypothetical protein